MIQLLKEDLYSLKLFLVGEGTLLNYLNSDAFKKMLSNFYAIYCKEKRVNPIRENKGTITILAEKNRTKDEHIQRIMFR